MYVRSTCPAAVQLHVCTRPGGLITYTLANEYLPRLHFGPRINCTVFCNKLACGIFEKIGRPPKYVHLEEAEEKSAFTKKRTDV